MREELIAGFDLDGKVALVVGASSGLGRRAALTLAKAGARVACAARRVERLEELAGEIEAFDGRALPLALDVGELSDLRGALDHAETELGPIDILVYAAGIAHVAPIASIGEEAYDHLMDTNLKGAFFVGREVAARMVEHGREGRIINIASMTALITMANLSIYAISKAALVKMTGQMAIEWARHGINVNAICPGYIETEMNAEFFRTDAGKRLLARFPRRRLGRPEDIDGLVLLLASPAARFITGAVIPLDDGQGYGL